MGPTLGAGDLQALAVTLRLAATTTLLLLILGTPLAWWLARTRSRAAAWVDALVALPLVLPPTVLGFYLLVLMGPRRALRRVRIRWLRYRFGPIQLEHLTRQPGHGDHHHQQAGDEQRPDLPWTFHDVSSTGAVWLGWPVNL